MPWVVHNLPEPERLRMQTLINRFNNNGLEGEEYSKFLKDFNTYYDRRCIRFVVMPQHPDNAPVYDDEVEDVRD